MTPFKYLGCIFLKYDTWDVSSVCVYVQGSEANVISTCLGYYAGQSIAPDYFLIQSSWAVG